MDSIIHRQDGSYVINDNTYHVPNEGEWKDRWAEVHAYATAHPECVTEELPPPEPDPAEVQAGRASAVRNERDRRLTDTDYLVMPDYPAPTDAVRLTWLNYRQALRNMPNLPGFPWTGVDSAPWPEPPAPITIKEIPWMM